MIKSHSRFSDGYRNAKFGQIQFHERITETSRELLMQIEEMAENIGFEVLHGIVDYLWVVEELILVFEEALNGLPKSGLSPQYPS